MRQRHNGPDRPAGCWERFSRNLGSALCTIAPGKGEPSEILYPLEGFTFPAVLGNGRGGTPAPAMRSGRFIKRMGASVRSSREPARAATGASGRAGAVRGQGWLMLMEAVAERKGAPPAPPEDLVALWERNCDGGRQGFRMAPRGMACLAGRWR